MSEKSEFENGTTEIVMSGFIGFRRDGYKPAGVMSAEEARQYNATQISAFSEADADKITERVNAQMNTWEDN